MLGQRRRWWTNINTVLGQRLVLSGHEENYYLQRLFGCVILLGHNEERCAIMYTAFLGGRLSDVALGLLTGLLVNIGALPSPLDTTDPSNANAGSLMVHRLRRWPNI